MKERRVTFAMDEEEYKRYMQAYRNMLFAGKCTNKSDFLRQALLAFCDNGQDIKQEGEQEASVDDKQDKPKGKFDWEGWKV